MAELYDEVVVYPYDAIRKTSEALSLVDGIRSDLEREARGQAEDTTGPTAAIDDIIKRDPLVHALQRSSRHITRLLETLSAQNNIPVDDYWLDGRHTMVAFEKSKAESSLNAAHIAANDTYQTVLVEIGNRMHSGRSYRAKMQSKIEMYDRVCATTAAALSAVTEGLYGFPATISRQRPRFERVAGASVGEGVAVEKSGRERKHRESFPERPIYSPRRDSVPGRAAVYDGDFLVGDRDRDLGRNTSPARRSSRKQRAIGRREEAEVIDLTGLGTRSSGCGGATASAANDLPAHSQLSPYPAVAMAADEWCITRRLGTGPSQSPSPTAAATSAADEWPLTPRPSPGPSPTAAASVAVADEWPLTPHPAPGSSPTAAGATAAATDEWPLTPRLALGPSPTATAAAAAAADEWPLTPRPAPVQSPTAAAAMAAAAADEWSLTPRMAPVQSPTAAGGGDAAVTHEWRAARAPGSRGRVTPEWTPSPPPTAAAVNERRVNLKPTSSPSPAVATATADERWVNPRQAAGPPQAADAAAAVDEKRVIPCSTVGARGRRVNGHPTAAAAVDERRRLMARASPDRFGARGGTGGDGDACAGGLDCTCSGGWVDAYAGLNRAREETRSAKGSLHSRKNRKPSAAEQHAASVNLMQGRSAMVPRRRNRQASERESATVTDSTDRPSRRVAARTSDRPLSPPTLSLTPLSLTAARAGGSRSDRGYGERRGNLRNHFAVENSDLLRDDTFQAILDDEDLVSLLNDTRSPRLSGEATRARRRSLVRMHSIGNGVNSTPVLRRSHSTGRSSRRARASLEELSPSSGTGSRDGVSGRDGDVSHDVDDDEAAAQRLFRQEVEARTREDELMAQQLAANEQARVERILSRHLRHYRRSQRHSDRASYVLNPAAAAAVATGDEVSDAVRALQFQDIDENDFDTLLTLDEQGGVGGRNCAGRRGLDEDVLRGLLGPWTGTATGEEELCSICLDDYGENKKITTLPCGHAFHHQCIKRSLRDNNRCPVDMKPVVPDSPNSVRGAGNG